MYGSIFCSVTRNPRASNSAPIEAAASPLPRDETTPPVTKMYFGANSSSFRQPLSDMLFFHRAARERPVEPRVAHLGEHARHRRAARNAERDDVIAAEQRGTRREPDEPDERIADGSRPSQPEPAQLDGGAVAEQARALTGRAGGEESGSEQLGRRPRTLERHERAPVEPEAGERGGGDGVTLVGDDRERGELERMEGEQLAPREIRAGTERIDQAELARRELDRHGVDGEIAPPQILADAGRHHAGERTRRLVALRARRRDVDAPERGCVHRRGQEP